VTVEAHRIAVLVPAFNEAHQIAGVLTSLPDFVDDVVVVDDASTDGTADVVRSVGDPRVHLIVLPTNRGVGGALAEAYTWAREAGVDIAVTMDGDGQMDPADLRALIAPIISGAADYTKGNRLTGPDSWQVIPRVRLFGNSVLSLLTKIVSGYWAVADSQSGFTAISRVGLERIDWHGVYPRYGRPNDVLIHANLADLRVADVPIRAVYGVGEKSSMKVLRVTFGISGLLFRRFWWRMFHKYVLRDFHPLVFFYSLSAVTSVAAVALFVRLCVLWAREGFVPQTTALTLAFVLITTFQSVFFAMWMDMEANADLSVKLPRVPLPPGQRTVAPPAPSVEDTAASGGRPALPEQGPDAAAPQDDRRDEPVARDVDEPGAQREGERADLP
jgi:glycosyltransferase involved in cell wall biosynthesis